MVMTTITSSRTVDYTQETRVDERGGEETRKDETQLKIEYFILVILTIEILTFWNLYSDLATES